MEQDADLLCPDWPFPDIDNCSQKGREKQTIVSDLDGTLLRSRSAFPYYMLIAFEAGSPIRFVILLLACPIIWLISTLVSESAALKLQIFITFCGLKLSDIHAVSRGVLPKFYLEDLHSASYYLFCQCGKRFVVTETPRVMVEPFLKEYLGVEAVMGTELAVTSKGAYATGFVTGPAGVLVGPEKARVVKKWFGDDCVPDVGIGESQSDHGFMALCKEAYYVPSGSRRSSNTPPPVPKKDYLKPLIFHDGRLVSRPTPLAALVLIIYTPVGLVLAIVRLIIGILLPLCYALPIEAALGVTVRVRGNIPPPRASRPGSNQAPGSRRRGVLFVCSHRTLLDPICLSIAARRGVTAVTYSISRISELFSPIRTVPLSRCRATDAQTMLQLLEEGDLAVCPEGTTCREPYLLRFSSLFAELAETIVPVTMNVKVTVFHGTTARGWKCLDPLFFFMNPCPRYEVTFLEELPREMSCTAGGKSSHEVANYVQRLLAASLGFECTQLTRRDKYRVLVGNDGVVERKGRSFGGKLLAVRNHILGC